MRIFLLVIAVGLIAFSCAWAASFSQEAVSYRKQAEEALERGDIDQAITFCQKTIALDDTDVRAHNILGMLYEGRNRLELAQQEYQKALSLDPKYLDALVNLARLCEGTNQKEKTIELLEKFITFAPPKDKRISEVKNKIIELTTPRQRKSDVVKRVEEEQADKLAKEITQERLQGKKEKEKKAQNHFSSGKSYHNKKQYSLALEEFKTALTYDPTDKNVNRYMNLCKEKINQSKKEAQDKLDKELAKEKIAKKRENEKQFQKHFSSGKSYYNKKQYSLALEEFKTALTYDSTNKNVSRYLKLSEEKINQSKKQTQGEKKKK